MKKAVVFLAVAVTCVLHPAIPLLAQDSDKWMGISGSPDAMKAEKNPATHVTRIHKLKQENAHYTEAIARERRVGAIAGFVNKDTLYQAGQLIEANERTIAREYQLYRASGGKLPLAALR